jgi:hypothetical protein
MPQRKPAPEGMRSKKALFVLRAAGLGAAGLTLALPANGSAAAMPSPGAAVTPMAEEEISDVTLATFHVYDKNTAGVNRSPLLQLTRRGCGCGCGGPCAGCSGGCGKCRCGAGGCCLSWGGCRPWC